MEIDINSLVWKLMGATPIIIILAYPIIIKLPFFASYEEEDAELLHIKK